MRKILYIGGFELPDKNAAAQRVMANAMLMREMCFDVSFFGVSKDIKNAPPYVNDFSSFTIPYPTDIKQWYHHVTTFINVSEIIDRKPDYVVLYNFPSIASLKILNACHKYGIKVIHDLTEWESSDGWDFRSIVRKLDIAFRMRYCMKRMDGIICISRYLYNYYKDFAKCIFVPPTVDLCNPKWNRDRVLTASNKIKLVYAGNAGFGQKDRLDTIVESVLKHPNMQLDVIGMTKDQYVEGYGEIPIGADNILFHGRVPHLEALKAVQNADFQFLIRDNNLKNNAGFPTKFVESISCCTPIIATLTSNIGDYLKDGFNGFVVSDSNSLDTVLDYITSLSPERIVAMKESCRSINNFDYHLYQKEFSSIFV